MSLRRPLLAALVALVLFGVYVADRRERTAAAFAATRITALSFDDVTDIVLENDAGSFVLEKGDGGDWWLVEPRRLRADEDQLRALVDNVRGAKKGARFEPRDAADYGLAAPRQRLSLSGPGGAVTLAFGDDAPRIGQVYARVEGEDLAFTVGDWVRNQAMKDLQALRAKGLTTFDAGTVERITVDTRRDSFAVEWRGGQWWIPGRERPANADFVASVLASMDRLRAVEIVDDPSTPMAVLGLDPPLLSLGFTSAAGTDRIEVGEPLAGRDLFPVRSTAEPGLAFVRGATMRRILVPPVSWETHRMFWTLPADFRRVETRSGNSEMVLEREGDGAWRFRSSPDLPVNPRKLEAFLAALGDLRGIECLDRDVADPEELRAYGIRPESFEVVAFDASGQAEGFRQGRTDAAEGSVLLLRIQDNSIWSVDFRRAATYTKFRADLADNRIFKDLVGRVASVTQRGDGVALEIEHRNGAWTLRAPNTPSRLLGDAEVTNFLQAVEDLEWISQFPVDSEVEASVRLEFRNADGEVFYFIEELPLDAGNNVVTLRAPDGEYEVRLGDYRRLFNAMTAMYSSASAQ